MPRVAKKRTATVLKNCIVALVDSRGWFGLRMVTKEALLVRIQEKNSTMKVQVVQDEESLTMVRGRYRGE
jgi:hypothetical protein